MAAAVAVVTHYAGFALTNVSPLQSGDNLVVESNYTSDSDVSIKAPNVVLLGTVRIVGELVINAERCFLGGNISVGSLSCTGKIYHLTGSQQEQSLQVLRSIGIFLRKDAFGNFTYVPQQNAA